MKIKRFKFNQLLKLHLLKSRVYETQIERANFDDLLNVNLDQVLVGIKKSLQIIFQYNQTKNRILFIGLPSKLELKINSLTQHAAISNTFNVQGLISNNNVRISAQTDLKQLSSKLAKKPDLIVLFDHEKSEVLLSEAWIAKIPVITFVTSSNLENSSFQNFYFVNGNFKNILTTFDKNIFFIGLNFLFKNLKKRKTRVMPLLPNTRHHSFGKF